MTEYVDSFSCSSSSGSNLGGLTEGFYDVSTSSSPGGISLQAFLKNLFVCGALAFMGTSVAGGQPSLPHVGTSPTLNNTRVVLAQNVSLTDDLKVGITENQKYDQFLTMSAADQAREILAALAINKSQLAKILGVTRPTLYSWFDGTTPSSENSDRLLLLLHIISKTEVSGTTPINNRFIRQPLSAEGNSILDILQNDQWDEASILELLSKAKELSDKVSQRRTDRNTRLRELGYEEPTTSEAKSRLAKNISMMEWNK